MRLYQGMTIKFYENRHLPRDIYGYIRVLGGNHKIIVDLQYEGATYRKFPDDIANYMYYYNTVNDVEVSLFLTKVIV